MTRMALLDESLSIHEADEGAPGELRGRCSTASSPATRATSRIGEALEIPPGTIASRRLEMPFGKLRRQLEGRKPRFEPSP